jgi:phytoene dehydrogenase-like protein
VTDAVVIGSGPNGLVAANVLADSGWSVVVVEAQSEPGGAVRTDGDVCAGFRHDTFSAFYPLAAVSPAIRSLRLEDHGLTWVRAPAVLGNPLANGDGWALVHDDRHETAAGLEAMCPGDGAAWLRLCKQWDAFGAQLIESVLSPFPPIRSGTRTVAALVRHAGVAGLGLPLMSVRRLADSAFRGQAAGLLLAGNALHADFDLDDRGSGLFGLILTMLAQSVGFPAPRGGAGELTKALVRRLESRGGSVATNAKVTAIIVRSDRAVGVRLSDGTEVAAGRAVVAAVTAPALYGGLVGWDDLPVRVRLGMRRFRWDPATVKVDWALSSPVPWDPAPASPPGTVHLAHSVDALTSYTAQLRNGLVPSDPLVVMGQMTTTDPTRSPPGTESAWAYCHAPQRVRGDAAAEGIAGRWDSADLDRMADRMQSRIERFAPGFGELVLARRVMGPRELEIADANLQGGAINAGTARLRQQLVLRPVPGLGRAETPIRRLYLASASAHPGGGVHGAPGANAARAALAHGGSR